MKQMVKKFACVAIACAMVLSATACKKSDSKKESSGVVSAAEEILEALTSLNMKKIKKIDAFSDCLEDLQVLADCEPIAEMMKKATFEVNEDSVSEKKKKASCDATITLPDYEAAVDEADGDPDAFMEAIEAQKEKKYQSVDVTLEFEVEDDEYTLSNGQELAAALYEDIFDNVLSSFGDPSNDPEPTDTDTTDPKPTDTDPTDPEPTDTKDTQTTGTTTSAEDAAPLTMGDLKQVNLTEDAFKSALKAADPQAAASVYDMDDSDDNTTKTLSGYSDDFLAMYSYTEYADANKAKEYFESYEYMKDSSSHFVMEDDWGYIAFQYSTWTYFVYRSGNAVVYAFALDGSQEVVDRIGNFAESLAG